jgi:dihydrofolate reductase
MGKLVVSEIMALDGVFEDPGGAEGFEYGGWSFKFDRGPDGDRFKLDELRAADALLLGRVTYEGFAAAWPAMEETAGEFGAKMNSIPKYVVSSTLQNPAWRNSTVIAPEGAMDEVGRLKRDLDGDLLVNGSGRLARALFDRGLVDEYRALVAPIALGTGRRLFDGLSAPVELELTEARPAAECLIEIYKPRR